MARTNVSNCEEQFAYLSHAFGRLFLFSSYHLAALATTLARLLAISMSADNGLLYFWTTEWPFRQSVERLRKDCFSVVDPELFLASTHIKSQQRQEVTSHFRSLEVDNTQLLGSLCHDEPDFRTDIRVITWRGC